MALGQGVSIEQPARSRESEGFRRAAFRGEQKMCRGSRLGVAELTSLRLCVTLRHMKTVTIRELHAKTGELVRDASRHGHILVTDNGRTIAKIVPETNEPG